MIYAILAILLLLSAFFSSLETGLLSLGEIRIREWASGKITALKEWINQPAGVITGILVGNNLVNIVFSSVFTLLVVRYTAESAIRQKWVEVISIIGSSTLILIAGEIIPKTYANSHPDRIVGAFFRPFMLFYKIAEKVINILNKISFSITGVMKSEGEKMVSRKELRLALEEIQHHGVMEKDSSMMLGRVLFLTQKTVGEVMIPRKMIYAINLNWPVERIMETIMKSRYSRIPAYTEKLDNIKGFIYVKDVIGMLSKREVDFWSILRKPFITYPGRNCQHLFQELRKLRTHCAVVKSRERVAGLVTIEDLIEEIVGEIYDEYDFKFDTA